MNKFDNLKAVGAATLAMITLPSLGGCGYASETNSIDSSIRATTKAERMASIKDMGNGVYVFPSSNFAETLSDFKGANPNLRVSGMSTNDDTQYGSRNYVINTEPK